MLDPHTKESRGFGFVNMTTPEQADAAKEGLQGEVIEGRTLSIEKARRSRPRTPTPGKYFGPPKRGEFDLEISSDIFFLLTWTHTNYFPDGRGPPRRDRYDDRRGPGGGNWRRRDDDYYGGGGGRYRYDSYNDRRDYGRDYGRGGGDYRSRDYGGRDYRRDSRDDYGYRGGPDRYSDRYSRDDRRDDRRGGGSGGNGGDDGGRSYYDRDANAGSYDAAPPREPRESYSGGGGSASGGRSYEGRGGEDRYGSR